MTAGISQAAWGAYAKKKKQDRTRRVAAGRGSSCAMKYPSSSVKPFLLLMCPPMFTATQKKKPSSLMQTKPM